MRIAESNITCHKPGDIIFTRSKALTSKLNVFFQKNLFDKKETEYSHVYLCVTNGVFVEANIGELVKVFDYRDEIASTNTEEWKVYRHKVLSNSEEIQNVLFDRVFFHVGKSYDKALLIKSALSKIVKRKYNAPIDMYSPSAICSEVVALILKSFNDVIKSPVLENNSKLILPGDLEAEFNSDNNWEKIEYKMSFDSEEERNLIEKISGILKQFEEKMNKTVEIQENEKKLLTDFHEALYILEKVVNSNFEELKSNKEFIQRTNDYFQDDEPKDIFISIYENLFINDVKIPDFSEKHFSLEYLDGNLESVLKAINSLLVLDKGHVSLILILAKGTLDIYNKFNEMNLEELKNNKILINQIEFICSAFKFLPLESVDFFKNKVIPGVQPTSQAQKEFIELANAVVKIDNLNLLEKYEKIRRDLLK
ncbi:MAG: hypothetical protein ACQEXE_18450 [Bacillota bacterium]